MISPEETGILHSQRVLHSCTYPEQDNMAHEKNNQQNAQKGHGSHPPNPGTPTRAVPQARPQVSRTKPEAYPQEYVEDFDEPRTMPGERRVSACRGWAGEKSGFFSILL